MSDLLQDYIDEFKEFLPKTYKSSPISKQVKAKVLEVMVKRLSFSPSVYGSEKLRLRILSSEPFELGLLAEVLEKLNRNFTYYAWERVDSAYELTLYKEKPKEYMWYLLQVWKFIVGYFSMIIATLITGYFSSYYIFSVLSVCSVETVDTFPTWFNFVLFLGVSFILTGIYIGLYMMVSRLYLLDESFKRILYFGTIESIDKPTVL